MSLAGESLFSHLCVHLHRPSLRVQGHHYKSQLGAGGDSVAHRDCQRDQQRGSGYVQASFAHTSELVHTHHSPYQNESTHSVLICRLIVPPADGYGSSIAMSADGVVAAVGAPYRDYGSLKDVGSFFIFKVHLRTRFRLLINVHVLSSR